MSPPAAPVRDRPPRAWRPIVAAGGVALLVAQFVHLAVESQPLLFLAALLPALTCAGLAIGLDGGAHAPRRLLAGAFLWGAVVAPAVAAGLNGLVRAELGPAAAAWGPTLGAPFIEESAKAVALVVLVVVWRSEMRGVADGITYGVLVGAGFTMAENLFYFAAAVVAGGADALAESVYLRAALGGFTHATFTASTGAGVGRACRSKGAARVGAPVLGFLLAVMQHAAWNTLGAPWLDTAPCAPRAAAECPLAERAWYWLVTAPAIVLLFIGPGLAVVIWLGSRDRGATRPDRWLTEDGNRL